MAEIERMLDQTHDPIADFINAVTADVIAQELADFKLTRELERATKRQEMEVTETQHQNPQLHVHEN